MSDLFTFPTVPDNACDCCGCDPCIHADDESERMDREEREDEQHPACPKCGCRYDHEAWCLIGAEATREYFEQAERERGGA